MVREVCPEAQARSVCVSPRSMEDLSLEPHRRVAFLTITASEVGLNYRRADMVGSHAAVG